MSKSRLPAMKDDDEISPDILNDVLLTGAKAQSMPSLTPRKEAPAPVTVKRTKKLKPRSTNAISLPDYVWKWVRDESRKKDEAQNVIIMRYMMQGGAPINEEDLVDGRRKRWTTETE